MDKFESDTLNLAEICRTCKRVVPQMRSLFEGYENADQSPRIDEMLMDCASVQVMCGDGLPAQICQACVEKLRDAFTFKRQVEKIDANLRQYAKNVKVDEIKQEPQNLDFVEPLNTLSSLSNEQTKENNQEQSDSCVILKTETDHIQFLDDDQILLTCCECSKSFSTVKELRGHKRTHTKNLYMCSMCDKQYTSLTQLQQHEESHPQKKKYICKICNETIVRMEHLKKHLVSHSKEKSFSCKTCNKIFSTVESLRSHMRSCKRNVYPCNICNKTFNRKDSLEVHKKTHDNQPKMPIIENVTIIEHRQSNEDIDTTFSDYCDVDNCFEPLVEVTESVDDDRVEEMFDLVLNDEEDNVNKTSVAVSNHHDSSTKKVIECLENEIGNVEVKVEVIEDNIRETGCHSVNTKCDAGQNPDGTTDPEYLPNKSLSPNMKRGQGRSRKNLLLKPLKVRDKNRDQSKFKKMDKEEYKEFSCPVCQEIFNTMNALANHAKIKHDGLKVYKCNMCDKKFNRVNHLNRHVLSHSAVTPYSCVVCNKGFKTRDTLNRHQKLHDRSNDFECDICHRVFNRPDLFANHRASKHGIVEKSQKSCVPEESPEVQDNEQREYQCTGCEKTFLLKTLLNRHMKFHNEQGKKFLCSECGQRFFKNDNLIAHMRRHRGEKPFKCKYCAKGFPRTTDLRVHERYHTGEKNHLCTLCGKGFGRAYNLTVHMRIHTGEKPYQCTYCDAAFVQVNDLKIHIRRHTGERYQCELCSKNFVKKYLLTQHQRTVHGLDVVGNSRRLQPLHKEEDPDEPSDQTST